MMESAGPSVKKGDLVSVSKRVQLPHTESLSR